MKTVYFCRHAKSSWEDMSLRDHDRPLNHRGRRDAPIMAQHLSDMGAKMDGIWTSTAVRAHSTAQTFADVLNVAPEHFHRTPQLYHSSPDQMIGVLRETIADYQAVGLFAHNPGMTQMANLFSPNLVDNVPTCGVFRIDFEVDEWSELDLYSSSVSWHMLWTPKSIR